MVCGHDASGAGAAGCARAGGVRGRLPLGAAAVAAVGCAGVCLNDEDTVWAGTPWLFGGWVLGCSRGVLSDRVDQIVFYAVLSLLGVSALLLLPLCGRPRGPCDDCESIS